MYIYMHVHVHVHVTQLHVNLSVGMEGTAQDQDYVHVIVTDGRARDVNKVSAQDGMVTHVQMCIAIQHDSNDTYLMHMCLHSKRKSLYSSCLT